MRTSRGRWGIVGILSGILWSMPSTALHVIAVPSLPAQASPNTRQAVRPPRVSASPRLRIVSPDAGPGLFETVAGVTMLPNGQVVVGNRGEHALLLFSKMGAFERAVARKGRGPGEVSSLLSLHRCGDAIWTVDIAGMRGQRFTPSLGYESSRRFPADFRRACNAAGHFLHMGWETGDATGVHRPNVRYWLSGPDSSSNITLGTLPGEDRFGQGSLPLGRSPRVAVGRRFAYIAFGDSLVIQRYTLDGKPAGALRAPQSTRTATAADWTAAIERQVRTAGEQARATLERMYAAAPRPGNLPATLDMLVDSEDLLWVQHYPRAGHPTVDWTVFAPSGQMLTTLSLPAALEVHEIGRNHLIGVVMDEQAGLPHIHVHALSR